MESSGGVARYLNKIVNLDVIDRSLSHIKRQEVKTNLQIETTKKKIEHLQQLIETAPDFSLIDSLLNGVEKKAKIISRNSVAISTLTKILQEIVGCRERLKCIHIPSVDFNEIDDKITLLSVQRSRFKKIFDLIKNIKLVRQTIIDIEGRIEEGRRKLKKEMPEICPLCEQIVNQDIL